VRGFCPVRRIGGDGPSPGGRHDDLNALESLYFAALEKPRAERPAFLDAACRGDTDLRARVERLLAAQPRVGGFLDAPAASAEPPADPLTATFGTDPAADYCGRDERAGAVIAGSTRWSSRSARAGWGRCGGPSRPSR